MDATIGPYSLGESLGATPFGELIAASHTVRPEPLAVLLLDDRLAKDNRFRGLLRLENARAGGLRHPALARTIEIAESAGRLYLVIERPAGSTTLAQALTADAPRSSQDIVGLVRRVAEGLDTAHARRLVHGALDPSCLLIGDGGAASVVGLGVLAAVEEAGLLDVVAERQGPAFVAPEQRGGSRAVQLADGYALGVVAATLARQWLGPAALTASVTSALDRQSAEDGSKRYPTCTAFATALADALLPSEVVQATQPAAASASSGASTTQTAAPLAPALPRPTPATPSPPGSDAEPPAPAHPFQPTPAVTARVSAADSPEDAPPPTTAPAGPSPGPAGAMAAETSTPADLASRSHDLVDASSRASLGAAPDLPWERADDGAATVSYARPRASSAPEAAPTVMDGRLAGTGPGFVATELDATPAMLATLRRLERRDPLGDAVRWVSQQVPALDRLLDRVAVDDKVGPVPLGIAAAGLVAVLLLVTGQILFATAAITLVAVLYGVPRLVNRLTASELSRQPVLRVTGSAGLQRHPLGPGWDRFELELANGITLGLPRDGYERLTSVGRPVTVDRPATMGAGTVAVTLKHTLSNVVVTYLALSNLLLDVRDASDTVLVRHPQYDGEPGDSLAPQPDATERAARPTTIPIAHGHATGLPMPRPVRAALEQARKGAVTRLALIAGVPLLVVMATINTGAASLAFVLLVALYIWLGAGALDRVLKLSTAVKASSLTQVTGPATLLQHARQRYPRYRLMLADDAVLEIDSPTHAALAQAGQLRLGEDRTSFWDPETRTEHLVSMHEVPSITVSYEPTAPLLLEIVNPFGQVLFRDAALSAAEIVLAPPKV